MDILKCLFSLILVKMFTRAYEVIIYHKFLLSGLFLILISTVTVRSQTNNLYFQNITSEDGLASNRVNCIYEDKTGFLWFGTQDGLNRYNGYKIEVYRNDPNDTTTIVNNIVTAILEENSSGNLWIGTEGGLCYLNLSTQKFKRFNATMGDTLNTLFYDQQNTLWAGSTKGLYKYNGDNTFTVVRHEKDNRNSLITNAVYAIEQFDKNSLLIGTEYGLNLFDTQDFSVKYHTATNDVGHIQCIKRTSSNDFWVGTYHKGMFRMRGKDFDRPMDHYNKEKGYLLNDRVQEIIEDKKQNLYIADRDGGLIYLDIKEDIVYKYTTDLYNPNSINSKALRSMMLSASGSLWIGTYNSGINYVDSKRKKFEHYKFNFKEDGLINNNTRSMFEDCEGNIWIGTKEGGGLSKFNRKKGTFKHYKTDRNNPYSLQDDYIFSINEIDSRYLLVGTYKKGLAIFDKSTERFNHYYHNKDNPSSISTNTVYSIYKDSEGVIWIGTFGISGSLGYLNIFDPGSRTFRAIKEIQQVRCFCEENPNEIWLGTLNKGLFLYNKLNGKLTPFCGDDNGSGKVSSRNIISMTKDNKGNLWVGTDGRGLWMLEAETRKCTVFNEENGFPNNRILGVKIDDHNNLWLSTGIGILKFNPEIRDVETYDVNDGLQGTQFESYVSLKTSSGEMLFGGRNGFNIFHPDEIVDNKDAPPVVITDLKLFYETVKVGTSGSPLEKSISHTENLVLNHKQGVFTFEFVALNFTSPEKNQYKYMMEGFDEKWIDAGNKHEATYTNLPAGDYVFRVKASNNDGVWNEEGTSINITIMPPWWASWQFRLIALMLILAGVVYFLRSRSQKQKEIQKSLEAQVAKATEEVKNRNSRLEEARGKLSNIMNDVKTELGKASEELLEATTSQASTIEEVSSSIDQMSKDIKENADSARSMFENAQKIEKDANSSVAIVTKTVDAIENITESIKFISEFAQTTNILSLNATIEAAKAGQYGKSFGVVANEVKKLADQSQGVAKNIQEISESGLELSHEASSKIVELQNYIKSIVQLIDQIRESSQNQSYEASNVNQAIQQISTYINRTAQLAEKLDTAINTLSLDEQ